MQSRRIRLCLFAGFMLLSSGVLSQSLELGTNSIWSRARLFDEPGSVRETLRDNGVGIDASLSQFYQGGLAGNGIRSWQYGGKGDVFVTIDGQKIGLWPGLTVAGHVELLYGEDANALGNRVLLPVNTALGLPRLGGYDQDFSLVATQAFNERISLSVGKFNMLEVLGKTPLVGGGGAETFMNLALAAPITGLTPPYLAGASLTVKTDPVILSAFVYDPRNAQDPEVLRTLFREGVTGMVSATFPYKLSGRSGFLGAKAIYSNKEGADLADLPELVLPQGGGTFLGTKKGSWFLGASFQQYLVQNPENPQQGWGVFGQIGFSDGNPNPIQWSAFVGVGGNSFIAGRSLDRWGVAYFRYSLSSDLRDGLGLIGARLRDEQGIEAFYSVAVTPWLSVSANIQVVQPVLSAADTAVTASLRTRMRF